MAGPNPSLSQGAVAAQPAIAKACEQIVVTRTGAIWTIKHGGSVLGHSNSSDEAARLAHHLADWVRSRDRSAEVVFEEGALQELAQRSRGAPN